MKKLITYVFILFCVNAFAQKTYTFDYYTVYEFRTNEQDSIFTKDITIANSKNPNYFIKISTYTNKTGHIVFYDLDSNESYSFSSERKIDENMDFSSLFDNPVPFNFNLNLLRKKSVDKYDVIYQNNEIIVRRYKNK